MFGNKNKKENKAGAESGNVMENVSVNDVPMHTMQDDLDMAGNMPLQSKELQPPEGNIMDKNNQPVQNQKVQPGSPFLGSEKPLVSEQTAEKKGVIQKAPEKIKGDDRENISFEESVPKNKRFRWRSILITVVLIIILLSLAGAGYFFWTTRYASPIIETEPVPNSTPEPEPESEVQKYSSVNPNYLSFDVEDNTSDLGNVIKKISEEIVLNNYSDPIEFIVTDRNNNPISFKIFSILMDIELSENVLSQLDEGFSLFIYKDKESARLGLSINLSNKESAQAEVKNAEPSLVESFAPLFLDEIYQFNEKEFKDGTYNEFSIRYINLDENNSLSVDYVFIENEWVIGTSKDSTRAILDKLSSNSSEAESSTYGEESNSDGSGELVLPPVTDIQ